MSIASMGYLGVIVYEGPSLLDCLDVVVVATCIDRPSQNVKTGPVIQVYVLPKADPFLTMDTAQFTVCGDCKHCKFGTCYVRGDSVSSVARALQNERYVLVSPSKLVKFSKGRNIRLVTKGDGAAVPIRVWRVIIRTFNDHGQTHTGFTHQWRLFPELGEFFMASVDSPEEHAEAKAMGLRTFRSRLPEEPLLPGEIECPATRYPGKVTCNKCGLCDGNHRTPNRRKALPDISVIAHGPDFVVRRYREMRYALKA